LARASRRAELTPWDGIVRPDHPLILETLAQEQSPSSLRQLLRDPQSFVWRYALGWHATLEEARTLSLDDRDFGDLVHRLLQQTVERLESGPGFAQAAEHEVDDAMSAASARVLVEWPTQRPTPPPMLWRHTLDDAARLALSALRLDSFQPGTRSWTEVAFGEPESSGSLPWDPRSEVMIPGTAIRIRGRIDRVEIAAGDRHVRITDYKTGSAPRRPEDVVLAGGRELQRVLYGVAARQHLPDAAIRAELVYLGEASPRRYRINDPDAAMRQVARMLSDASEVVRRGLSLPGPDSDEPWNRYRLARPAVGEAALKRPLIAAALRDLAWVWSAP
jgi:ATP-dependent helicase/DNAse subunit B